ncbi:MAG TPA: hypothetical protein VF092_09680 [Longimicrobium sp.]
MIFHASNHRRRGSIAALFVAALAIAGCRDLTGALPEEGPPDELVFSFGGFGVGSTTIELHGDSVVITHTPTDFLPTVPPPRVSRVPSPDEWRAFWDAARRAGVHRWRHEYRAEGVVDGSGWDLRIVSDGRTLESSGSNAYPDQLGREHELEMTEAWFAFRLALETLAGQPSILPRD